MIIREIFLSRKIRLRGRMICKSKQNYFIIITFFEIKRKSMKNNYIPSFHKKENENFSKTTPSFLTKNTTDNCENTVKMISFHVEASSNSTGNNFPFRNNKISEEGSKSQEQQSCCKSSQTMVISYKNQQNTLTQERIKSPSKNNNVSPLQRLPFAKSIIKQSHQNCKNFMPMRATMKNLPTNKSPFLNIKKELFFDKKDEQARTNQLNTSHRANKALTQFSTFSPPKGIQRQYQRLRQQNESLRNELNEIKKNLFFCSVSKKEELISNLRGTIKKQDSEINQLRIKIDIFTKKNTVLQTLIENKDQQIEFLSNQLAQVETELQQHKEKNAEKFQKLKQRINYMIKSYNDLEIKWSQAQMEWLEFKQKWLQEKEIYFQRITFLEGYISQNCA